MKLDSEGNWRDIGGAVAPNGAVCKTTLPDGIYNTANESLTGPGVNVYLKALHITTDTDGQPQIHLDVSGNLPEIEIKIRHEVEIVKAANGLVASIFYPNLRKPLGVLGTILHIVKHVGQTEPTIYVLIPGLIGIGSPVAPTGPSWKKRSTFPSENMKKIAHAAIRTHEIGVRRMAQAVLRPRCQTQIN